MGIFGRKKTSQVQAEGPTTELPEAVASAIPPEQRGGPVEQLEDGRFLIAGRDVVLVANAEELIDSGFYYEVQYASWEAQTRKFRLVWSQPERPGIEGVTVSENPSALMKDITDKVNHTIVATRKFVTSAGVTVAASVRARPDGELFSVVVAGGPISPEDEQRAYEMEDSLRKELGLES